VTAHDDSRAVPKLVLHLVHELLDQVHSAATFAVNVFSRGWIRELAWVKPGTGVFDDDEYPAAFLNRHKKVKKVFYPGLPDHPQYELAERQMTGFGSMITLETGSLKNAQRMLRKLHVCFLGESLGGVETLISHPATMTHAALGEKGRREIGITDGMVRISVGIEDADDIIRDLEQALAAT